MKKTVLTLAGIIIVIVGGYFLYRKYVHVVPSYSSPSLVSSSATGTPETSFPRQLIADTKAVIVSSATYKSQTGGKILTVVYDSKIGMATLLESYMQTAKNLGYQVTSQNLAKEPYVLVLKNGLQYYTVALRTKDANTREVVVTINE